MSVEIGLLEQSLERAPREVTARFASYLGQAALHTRIVVGLKYPDGQVITANGYTLYGNEDEGATITLAHDQAERLAIAYAGAMIEKPKDTVMQCDSFVDYVMAWRETPYYGPNISYGTSRHHECSSVAADLNCFDNGTVYEFSRYPNGRRKPAHVVMGTSDPTRNLSKFGNEPMLTMRNSDTAKYYTREGNVAIAHKVLSVARVPSLG